MAKKQEKHFVNIKERDNGHIYISACRLTTEPTLSLYHI